MLTILVGQPMTVTLSMLGRWPKGKRWERKKSKVNSSKHWRQVKIFIPRGIWQHEVPTPPSLYLCLIEETKCINLFTWIQYFPTVLPLAFREYNMQISSVFHFKNSPSLHPLLILLCIHLSGRHRWQWRRDTVPSFTEKTALVSGIGNLYALQCTGRTTMDSWASARISAASWSSCQLDWHSHLYHDACQLQGSARHHQQLRWWLADT